MNEGEFRAEVVKRRKEWKRSDDGYVPDHTWHWLEAEGYMEDAEVKDFDEDAIEDMVRRIDKMHERAPRGDSRKSVAADDYHHEPVPEVGEYVSARAKAISEVLAMLADQRPDVANFRRKVLGGRSRTPEEAQAMVGTAGAVADEVHKLGARLADDYLGWDEEGAVRYVLTGEAPQLRPIEARGRGKFPSRMQPFQSNVTLTVLPWVPAKEVERVYRVLQEQLLEETSRETGPRILEVAQFVWERLRLDGERESWRAWFELWNQRYPDKKFKTWRHFYEYCRRGSEEALPLYKFPEPKPTPELQREIERFIERFRKRFSTGL